MNEPARLLLVRRGGLGDTLLLAPVLRALARAHPDAELHVAGVRDFAVLLAHVGLCRAVWSSEDLLAWSRHAPERWRAYGRVFADDAGLAAAAAHGPAVVCYDPAPRDRRPLPQQLAGQLGVVLQWPQDAHGQPAPRAAGGPVVLAPGSGGRAKCWPRPHWLQLAGALAARGERLEVLVGPAELERDDPRRWPWPAPVAAVVAPDLVPVAERLRQARAFVGNDSGTSHLAALLGVPTVAIFGPSDPAVFAPLGPRVRVLGGGDPQFRVAVPEVLAALAALG